RELVVVTTGGRVAAFTVTWVDEVNKVGHFEPVGTHRDFRGRGLARAMMLHGLERMRSLGMEAATVEYDASNVPARNLYAGIGFVKRFETFGFRRPADSYAWRVFPCPSDGPADPRTSASTASSSARVSHSRSAGSSFPLRDAA